MPATDKKPVFLSLLVIILAVSLVFVLVSGVILGAQAIQMEKVNPVNHKALEALGETISRYPKDDELKEVYRSLDVVVRQEQLRGRRLLQRGKVLFAVGAGLLLASLGGLLLLLPRFPSLRGPDLPDDAVARATARRGIAAAVLAVLVIAVVLSWPQRDASPVKKDPAQEAQGKQTVLPDFDAVAGEWPAFRGVGAAGVASESCLPPLKWDGKKGDGVLWKVKPPRPGFSSPIVWQERVFLTGGDSEAREIYCFSAADGALLWRADTKGIVGSPAKLPKVTEDTGFAPATPVTDGERVYAIFPTGNVLAVDFSGKRVWGVNLGLPDNPYGHASSLVVHRGRLLVQYDHFGSQRFLALEATTGKLLWEKAREVSASWGTPVLARRGDRVLALLSAEPTVSAYDALTGDLLWKTECLGGEVGPSPAFADGLAYFTTDYAVLAAIAVDGDKAGKIVWSTDEELPDVCSPVAANGLLFVPTSSGIVSCYDAKTGELKWRHEEFQEGYYASPVVVGKRLYMTDFKGKTQVVAAAAEFKLLAENSLGEPAMTTFAFRDKRAWIRGLQYLYCLGEEKNEAK